MNHSEIVNFIPEKIKAIEKKEHIKILYAAESGSRSWQVSAPDSDYDIRFIYIRRPKDYLRLDKFYDVLEFPIEENWDMSGWDLFKALGLLKKSNPRLFEWFNSPIVYTGETFAARFKPVMFNYFSPKNTMLYYLHTAKTKQSHILQTDTVKIKQYLYAIHPLMAAKWIINHNTPPPVIFRELMANELSRDIYEDVETLLDKKIHFPEQSVIKRVSVIDEYINREILYLENQINFASEDSDKDWEMLNEFFLNELNSINGGDF